MPSTTALRTRQPQTAALFQRVVCAIDFSDVSQSALRYGAEIVRRSGGALTVACINDPLLAPAAAAAGYNAKALAAETEKELARFIAGALPDEAPVPATVLGVGHAAPELLKIAAKVRADLLVMGSRGLSGPGKWMLGSTAARVLRKTRIPVLVVHDAFTAAALTPKLDAWPGERVLIPIDLDDYQAADLDRAVRVARFFDATPSLMNVVDVPRPPAWLMEKGARDPRPVERASTRLRKLALRIGERTECHVVTGEPAAQIVAVARSIDAGLIVLTIKRSPSIFGPRQGTIAYRVLCEKAAPVLAIPGAGA